MDEAYLKNQIEVMKKHLEQALGFATGDLKIDDVVVTKHHMIRANLKWAHDCFSRVVVGLKKAEYQAKEDADYINTIK